jgi:hypothetical protein
MVDRLLSPVAQAAEEPPDGFSGVVISHPEWTWNGQCFKIIPELKV